MRSRKLTVNQFYNLWLSGAWLKVAENVVLQMAKLKAPMPNMYELAEKFAKCKTAKEAWVLYELLVGIPRILRRDYREPCYSCKLTYQEPMRDKCSECFRDAEVMYCEVVGGYVCWECCDEEFVKVK